MIYGYAREPLIKRIPVVVDRTDGIQRYDADNLYPQRVEEIYKRSYTAKRCVNKLAEFTDGDGFVNPELSKIVLYNRHNQRITLGKALKDASFSKSLFSGFAFHIGYNLNYKISSIKPIPFKFCRYSLPSDELGNVAEIAYSTNWEQDRVKDLSPFKEIEFYPVYNPDPEVIREQIDAYGGVFNYPGQILYWTPEFGQYPECTFDVVLDQAQIQADTAVYELSEIQNGFRAGHVVNYPGTFDDASQKREFKKQIDEFKGPQGAGFMVVENPQGIDLRNLVVSVEQPDVHAKLEGIAKRNRDGITQAFGFPPGIMGILPESGMFNQEQIEEEYKYVNAFTRGERELMKEIFSELMSHWWQPVNADFTIKEQSYITTVSASSSPAQPDPNQPKAVDNPPVINEHLKNLTGKQQQQFNRIITQYSKGVITPMQAVIQLKASFGLSDDEIDTLLADVKRAA